MIGEEVMNGIQYSFIIGGAGEVPSADHRAGRIPLKSGKSSQSTEVSYPILSRIMRNLTNVEKLRVGGCRFNGELGE